MSYRTETTFSAHAAAERTLAMADLEERIARNNLLFREANEKIRAKSEEHDHPLERIPFLCECPVEGCTTIVRLTPDEYGSIRSDSTHFFTAPGHEQAEATARVISRTESYVVVKKSV
jgi:hypothetical protein